MPVRGFKRCFLGADKRSTNLNYLLLVGLTIFSSACGALLVTLFHKFSTERPDRPASQPKNEGDE
jgi:hypothetical protein